MTGRASSVVARARRTLGAAAVAAVAVLAACGQKGPLIGVKLAPPPVAAEVAPDGAIAVPASVPASGPRGR